MDPATLLLIGLGAWVIFQALETGSQSGGWSQTSAAPPPSGGGIQPTSLIAQIVAQLESGGGTYASQQPASMANPTYGQYSAFVKQYGSGAAGVDNFAQQILSYNPNATLGDFYSTYVLGTGSPSYLHSTSELESQYPSAYQNLASNAGVSLDTPLSQLV